MASVIDILECEAGDGDELSGTSADRTAALTIGSVYTLFNGPDQAICFKLGGASVTATTTSVPLPAGGQVSFQVTDATDYCSVIASDGSTAFKANVLRTSP